MKILLIEDDEEKATRISEVLRDEVIGLELEIARSFNSGLRAVTLRRDCYELILLDMSMPNYDVSPKNPSGGAPENFAGADLLAQMRLRGISIPTIVVTMFATFGAEDNRTTLDQLQQRLATQYSPTFRGLVYYSVSQEGWRTQLIRMIYDLKRTA